jgi:hypothetical protein
VSVVSKPATRASRLGHAAVYRDNPGHINAACCKCLKCEGRRSGAEFMALVKEKMADLLYNDPPEPTHFSGLDRATRNK